MNQPSDLLPQDLLPLVFAASQKKTLNNSKNNMILKSPFALLATIAVALLATDSVIAQDSISVTAGRPPRGKVTSTMPDKLVVDTSDGSVEVNAWDLKRIRFEGESNEITAAKTAYSDERYSACLQALNSLKEMPQRDVVKQEVAFYKAMAQAKLAMSGGGVAFNKAVTDIKAFIDSNPNSFHVNEAVDMFGDLAMTAGRFDQAILQFQKTSNCEWPEIKFNGQLKIGKAQLLSGKYEDAVNSFRATEASDNAEDYAVQAKLIARCLRAKALGMTGKPDEGIELVSTIIKNENSKNMALFANAYNAMGTCYKQAGKNKQAIRAFLRTDLLFFLEPDSHAEALFHLNDLWTKVERPDRAARSRQKMTQRYRNTYWASKLTN